eukprot:scaffold4478_cov385-Prasinococcus_capsulatus_cf.AAC.2
MHPGKARPGRCSCDHSAQLREEERDRCYLTMRPARQSWLVACMFLSVHSPLRSAWLCPPADPQYSHHNHSQEEALQLHSCRSVPRSGVACLPHYLEQRETRPSLTVERRLSHGLLLRHNGAKSCHRSRLVPCDVGHQSSARCRGALACILCGPS